MMNVDLYKAEADYRRESIRREFGGVFGRRALKAALRNRIADNGRADLGA